MMKIGDGTRIAGSIFLLATLLTVGGCGYKTEPVPPASIVPQAIDDLRYTIDEKGVTLNWSYPVKSIKGTDVVDISAFDVYRAVVPLSDLCENCPIPFGESVEIPGGITSEAGKRRTGEYHTSLLRSGHKYFFKIRSRTSWWAASGDSNIVSFVWHVPTSEPAGLKAVADDARIALEWQPVTTLIDGRKVEGDISYQVFRSMGGQEFEAFGDPVKGTRYVDTKVLNGKKYFYKVQSLLTFEGYSVNGGVSSVVSAVPVDKTPPPPPAGVKAVQTDAGIKIFWDRSSDPSVVGYRIYRRSADQNKPELIGEVEAAYSIFVDENAPAGVRSYYSVTAIDQSTPANESDFSREATTR